ncbi:hypothetical protein L226DRAFT_539707 [Lentinus tigrinus ALCF2SS1-7]|uniref:uncharacterized protein n=1 Tax=Lentinus tigrinus ALCF2SS1-7 TaxID=1328758 RepID=UPI0011662DD1|nr:hypothetical protein L226DRAFT_539707 [Lentinus tigrinus ALCF2SS1-7]
MTEYATDPETIQEYLNSRERCANWVNIHSQGLSYVSPSSPPSILSDDDTPMYGPSESDASSSHSLPPRMLLRYDDGRPDIPISQDPSPTHSRGQPQSSRHRSRSGSFAPPAPAAADVPHHPARYAQTLSYASGSRYAPTGAPENIRVLPSRQAEDSQRMPASTSSSHRSRAPPPAQGIFQQPSIHDRVPPLADHLHTSNRSVFAPTPRHATTTSAQPIPVIASPTHSHPAPGGSRFYEQPGMAASTMQNGLPYHYAPPAIVYAPSGRHASKYQPPAIVYSPSSHGTRRAPAPGIAYSRSDPLPHPTQYSPVNAGSTPFPPVHGSSSHHSRPRAHSTAGHEQSGGRTHGGVPSSSRSRTRTRTPSLSPSDSDTSSDTSGSTYYVLPSPGQKVQIIVPNSASVYTSKPHTHSSSSRSPRSPTSPESPKKPFLARIFSRGSGSVDSRGSSGVRAERGRIPIPWR